MVLNTLKCNHLTPLGLKGLTQAENYRLLFIDLFYISVCFVVRYFRDTALQTAKHKRKKQNIFYFIRLLFIDILIWATGMALDPSNISNLEQLALKGLRWARVHPAGQGQAGPNSRWTGPGQNGPLADA